jgi:hypothetical protein
MVSDNARDRCKKLIRDSKKTNKDNCKVYAALQHVVKRVLTTTGLLVRMATWMVVVVVVMVVVVVVM